MKSRYDGNMLMESIVGLMILAVALTMAMTAIINADKSISKRLSYDEVNRVGYSIMNEVKYNYSYEQIKNEIERPSSGNCISIKYTKDILEKLTTAELLNLERGNEIKIEVISVDDINKIVQMKVSINIQINGDVISSERSFDKLLWMHS